MKPPVKLHDGTAPARTEIEPKPQCTTQPDEIIRTIVELLNMEGSSQLKLRLVHSILSNHLSGRPLMELDEKHEK